MRRRGRAWPWGRGNRRMERDAELEVMLRVGAGGASWTGRAAKGLARLVLAVALVAGVLVGYALLRDHWLHRTEALALRELRVTTDGALSRAAILGQARVREGMNTFAIDLPALRTQLLRHPRIATAEVHRQWPSTLRIRVQERFPVARARVLDQQGIDFAYLLDEGGHVMLPFESGQASAEVVETEAGLPLVLGAQGSFVVGQATAHPGVRAALRLLVDYEDSPMPALTDVVSVDVSRAGELEVLTWLGSRVTFGMPDASGGFRRALGCWEAVHLDSASRGRLIGTLDLSVTNHVPLKWMEAPTEPAKVVPRLSKPGRRNVRRHG